MNIIDIKNVTVMYDQYKALDDVSLSVEQGAFCGLIGPNGGGKSTLLKTILGLIKPQSGTITINTKNPIGYVPQFSNFQFSFPITVNEVIMMGRLPIPMKPFFRIKKSDSDIANGVMDQLGITDLKERQISQLSGGQMQKVLIARALTVNPDILILDEPTSSIDSQSKKDIFNILKDLNKEMTILIVSHDIADITRYATKIACLNRKLHAHESGKLTAAMYDQTFKCDVDFIQQIQPVQIITAKEEDTDDRSDI